MNPTTNPTTKPPIRAEPHDIRRAYAARSATGMTFMSIPPSASIGEIEDLIDLMLALSSSEDGAA